MTNVCAIKWTCLTITQHLYIFLLVSRTRYDQCLCCLMDMLNYYSTLVPWFHRQDMINVCAISWTCFIIPLLYIFLQKAVHLDPWRPTASQRGAVLIFLRKPMATYDFSGRADPWVQSLLEGGPRTPIATCDFPGAGGPLGSIASRGGSELAFLRKHVATCVFPGGALGSIAS